MPESFVALRQFDGTILQDIRYAGAHNFLGRPVAGYGPDAECVLTKAASEALSRVQSDLRLKNLSLKVYDCYRPQRAVNDFVEWARDLTDTKQKAEFYPKVDKSTLFRNGYIAEKSGHSRGSTVDLTVVPLPATDLDIVREAGPLRACTAPAVRRSPDNSLDMGTAYDCFDPLANTANPGISKTARKNRLILKRAMEQHGFQNYEKEWWHFTLKNEPHPDTYFDF